MGLFFWICNYFSVEEFIIIPIWAFIKMADEQDPEIVVSLFQIQVRRFYLEHIDFLKKNETFFRPVTILNMILKLLLIYLFFFS